MHAGDASAHPPLLPFVLRVGITGHRLDTLAPEAIATVEQRLGDALKLLTERARALHAKEASVFAPVPPQFRIISPLADGADQIVAEAALKLGYSLQAVLPFPRDSYREDLIGDAAKQRFDTLMSRAECSLELPGERSDDVSAYVMVGRATVAHCDLLLGLWDGQKARGRGGTGEVVEVAIAAGTPVLHVPTDADQPMRLIWAAFDPVVDTAGIDPMAERHPDVEHVDVMLDALLMPPDAEVERKYLAMYQREQIRPYRWRIEYPLLLALFRVAKFHSGKFKDAPGAAYIVEEWRDFREKCVAPNGITAPLDALEEAYSWCDRLATHFAQTYRSGHIFNFVLGGVAVCLGLSAFMAPHAQFDFALAECIITFAVIFNAHIGHKNEWHRRWLDYRQLAERLRPMRSLSILALAQPDHPGTSTNPVAQRWIDWYSAGVWRAMSCPSGIMTPHSVRQIAACIAKHELEPQVSYNRRHAEQIEKLDQRLEKVGELLFWATLFVTVATVVGLPFAPVYVQEFSNWFTLVSAGFPALATAIFGIRFQADFGGSALRSEATAQNLAEIDAELHRSPSLIRTADLTEQAARRMLSDLDEWRLINQQRDVSV